MKGKPVPCAICGTEFEQGYKNQVCCSSKCAHIKGGNTIRQYPDKAQRRRELEWEQRRSDVKYVLNSRMRSRMFMALKRGKGGRPWEELVGYSVQDLKRHIEKQFTEGMGWGRFLAGEIHIDHEIPVSAFNFESHDDIDFKRCWSLENLRPMWAKENMSKHAKISKPFQPSLAIRA